MRARVRPACAVAPAAPPNARQSPAAPTPSRSKSLAARPHHLRKKPGVETPLGAAAFAHPLLGQPLGPKLDAHWQTASQVRRPWLNTGCLDRGKASRLFPQRRQFHSSCHPATQRLARAQHQFAHAPVPGVALALGLSLQQWPSDTLCASARSMFGGCRWQFSQAVRCCQPIRARADSAQPHWRQPAAANLQTALRAVRRIDPHLYSGRFAQAHILPTSHENSSRQSQRH